MIFIDIPWLQLLPSEGTNVLDMDGEVIDSYNHRGAELQKAMLHNFSHESQDRWGCS